jgi:hypothetical protein
MRGYGTNKNDVSVWQSKDMHDPCRRTVLKLFLGRQTGGKVRIKPAFDLLLASQDVAIT